MAQFRIRSSARRRGGALVMAAFLGLALPALAEEPVAPGAPDAAATDAGAPPPPPAPDERGGPGGPDGRGGPHGRWRRPPFDAVLEREAARLGLDDAALARIRAVADAARPESERLEAAVRDERGALHRLLSTDTPDRDAVMRQVEKIGAADTALEKQRIATMLEIRQLLTPTQRAELVKIFRERKEKREGWRRDRGEAPPPPPER